MQEVLASLLGARHVVVGESFRFGHGRQGDARDARGARRPAGLRRAGGEPGAPGRAPDQQQPRARGARARATCASAAELLGRPYALDGRVVRGDGRGRGLGIPTANLAVEEQLLPARGVYAGRVLLPGGEWRAAVVNVGERPTFGGTGLVVEAHLIDFAGDLYDARLRLSFQARLRGEERFASAAALVERIHADVRAARELLGPSAGV